jgi:putative transposase
VVEPTMDPVAWLRKHLEQADTDLLREMVRTFIQALMSAEADAICGAPYGERSGQRANRRNGYRERGFDTRAGTTRSATGGVFSSRSSARCAGRNGDGAATGPGGASR